MIEGHDIGRRLRAAGALLEELRDVVEGRVTTPEPPRWCRQRGFDEFLSSISDDALERAESVGLAHDESLLSRAPTGLRELAARVRQTTAVGDATVPVVRPLRRASERKAAQVAAMVALLRTEVRRASRIVDFGSGHGHLTRELTDALSAPGVGFELDPERVHVANALTGDRQRAQFIVRDAVADRVRLRRGDLLVGLHACGALGDALVQTAIEAEAALALVSCCLQKVTAPGREPVSEAGRSVGLALSRPILGLSNLRSRPDGVETPMADIVRARTRRYALRILLRLRGVDIDHGEETRGINRRRMYGPLRAVAEQAFSQRQMPPPTDAELDEASRIADVEYGAIRRLSLPRSMLGRVIEVAVVLDRAAALAERDRPTRVGLAFPGELSPRNVFIASAPPRSAASAMAHRPHGSPQRPPGA